MSKRNSTAIRFEEVCFSYAGEKLVDSFSFELAAGAFLCVIGASGSGKTTLLRLILGLEKPVKGAIRISGSDPLEARRRGICAYVPQQASLMPWLTVAQNVCLPVRFRGGEVSTAGITECLEKVGLAHAASLKPRQLSGGMQARASIARAWIDKTAQILVLDEPFASLDELRREELGELLARLWKGGERTVIYVTHNISEAIRLGTHILPIRKAQLQGKIRLLAVSEGDRKAEKEALRTKLHEKLRVGVGDVYKVPEYQTHLEHDRQRDIGEALHIFFDKASEIQDRVYAADVLKECFIRVGKGIRDDTDPHRDQLVGTLGSLWKVSNDVDRVKLAFRCADIMNYGELSDYGVFDWLIDERQQNVFCCCVNDYIGEGPLIEHVKRRLHGGINQNGAWIHLLSLLALKAEEREAAFHIVKSTVSETNNVLSKIAGKEVLRRWS